MSTRDAIGKVQQSVDNMTKKINELVGKSGAAPESRSLTKAAAESNTPVIVCVVFIIILVVAVVIGAICYTCKGDAADEIVIDARPFRIQNAREQAEKRVTQKAQAARKATTPVRAGAGSKNTKRVKSISLNKTKKTQLSSLKGKRSAVSLSRSQRLAKDIEKAKRPAKKSMARSRVQKSSTFKSAPTTRRNMRKISTAVNGASRMDSVPQSITDDSVMHAGSDARYTSQQIREGIRNVGRAGRDPSRALRLNSQGRSLGVRDPAVIVRDANRQSRRSITASVPCGANPTLQYYDYLQSQQQQNAIAAR